LAPGSASVDQAALADSSDGGISDQTREEVSFVFWSDKDLRIADEVRKAAGTSEEEKIQEQTASGPRRTWKQTSRLLAATGVLIYETGSTTFPAIPDWAWGPIGGAMAAPAFYRALRDWWHGRTKADEH